jgi:predicted RNA-binding Zn-ribbon protein involved in translation (DUF1610 family)
MQMHFRTCHNEDTIIIEEEGRLPQCPSCGIFQCYVGRTHQQTKTCTEFSKIIREHRKYQEKNELVSETVITVNDSTIKTVKEFKYLGHLLDDNDRDGPAVKQAIQRARIMWGQLSQILTSEGVDSKSMASKR